MLFNSLSFLIYLPIVFVFYWALRNRLKTQNLFVVIVSYIFYGWWSPKFLILITITSLCSYLSGREIELTSKRINKKKWCIANIVLNVGFLFTFKYFNFFIDQFSSLCSLVGWTPGWVTLNLVLPVGISFYTFQALSYTIDVYKGTIRASKDPIAFFAYISFFPQLVAGPIERATNLLPQFSEKRFFNYPMAVDGCRQMLWGFFKKMVIADNCAFFVGRIFDNYQAQSGSTLLIGAILFSFQIYGDFSGYSDIAIGCSRLFGINLMANFKMPYFSRDIAEFWRRWHISLNTWFRDYVYIPLGGSRCSKKKTVRNTFVIFLTSGLWHGANWTFIAWGGIHAIMFLPLLLSAKNRKHTGPIGPNHSIPRMKDFFAMSITFFIVMLAWVFFRSVDISSAMSYIKLMFDFQHFIPVANFIISYKFYITVFFILVLLGGEWINRNNAHGLSVVRLSSTMRYVLYIALTFCIIWFGGAQSEFIYFQF